MITVDSVIRSYLGDNHAATLHGYVRLLNYALEGYRELSIDVVAEVKTVKLRLDVLKKATMPTDYMKLIKVYAKIGDRAAAISEDGSISFHHDKSNTPNDKYADKRGSLKYGIDIEPDPTTLNNNDTMGNGYNNLGYFREKKDTFPRELFFSADITDRDILVEYLAQPGGFGSETVLSPLMSKCLNEYIGYKDSRYRFGESSAETQSRKMNFEDERRKLYKRESNLSLQTISDAYKQAYGENHLR